jgi:hypothetical protein
MRFYHSVDIYATTISRSHDLIGSASVQAETFDGDGQNATIDDSGLTLRGSFLLETWPHHEKNGELLLWPPGIHSAS